MIVRGDALKIPLADGCATTVVTSPPYLGQRIYGTSDLELGRESTLAEFVEGQVEVAKEVRRILVAGPTPGTYWCNYGDKANGSGGAGGDYSGGSKAGKTKFGKFRDPGFEVGQFLDVPGKVAAALQKDGWRLRLMLIWDKQQESRESLDHVNRPRVSHEVILMLLPSKGRGKFHHDRLPETGSVWHFPPAQKEKKGHDAPFPDELARRCIAVSSDVGDLVVDPFSGSGTTARVAKSMQRRGVGIELYP